MKIVHLNTSDIFGGAARAANRLHQSLLNAGVDSVMVVQKNESKGIGILGPDSRKEKLNVLVRSNLEKIQMNHYRKESKTLFSLSNVSSKKLVSKINALNPDIVHLHWVNSGMLRIEDIAKINAPIAWSLHDMWAFTGGCHYSEYCSKYTQNCGSCIVLRSSKENDLSRKVFNRKKKTYSKKKLNIIGLSKWLNDCSQESTLLREHRHINLPNPINTSIYKPIDKNQAREIWNLPLDKKVILFGAMSATSDPRKGYDELIEALSKLHYKDVELVVFGGDKLQDTGDYKFKTNFVGHLYDDISLITLYSAVDVMIVPSKEENLSNAIMESLACGTPVVGFNIGGNSDLVDHKLNGYLAKPSNVSDLRDGIEWVLNNSNYQAISDNAREKVLSCFESEKVAQKYIDFYKGIIGELAL